MTLQDITDLVGHSDIAATEEAYRHQLRPVLQHGAVVMDQKFKEDAA